MSVAEFEQSEEHGPLFVGWQPRECGEHRTVGDYRAWCFPLPAYRTVHAWVAQWRGPASAQACARCGQPGHDWSFDNRQPSWPSEEGSYYPDLSRYEALCRSCHIQKDTSTETCANGHRWADGNRYRRKDGKGTICRACRREGMARRRKRQEAE